MSQRGSYFGPILRPIGLAINKGGLAAWSPRALFAAGEQGAWYDPSDLSTLFQDSAGTTPVTAVGQPVGLVKDKSGRGNHASQATATARPTLQQDSGGRYYLSFDGVDDYLSAASGLGSFPANLFSALSYNLGSIAQYAIGSFAGVGLGGVSIGGSSDGLLRTYASTATAQRTPTGGAITAGQSIVQSGGCDGGASYSRTNLGNSVVSANDTFTTGQGGFAIGREFSGGGYFGGRIYGVVAMGGVTMPQDKRDRAVRYLAARSGVTL